MHYFKGGKTWLKLPLPSHQKQWQLEDMERYFTSTERKTKNKKQNPVNPEFYKQKKKMKVK